MAKILIVGDPTTPLERARGIVGQRAGHEIFWFSAQQADLPGVTRFSIPRIAVMSAPVRALLKPIYLRTALRQTRPDLVHVHYGQTGLMAFPLSKTHPLVVTVMGGDILPEQGYAGVRAYFIRLLLDNADCITSKSDFMDGALDKIGKYRNKIKRVVWGIDLARFHPERDVNALRERWLIPAADLVFFDPRLAKPFYNKHVILEAFAAYLGDEGPSATLLVAEAFAEPAYLVHLRQRAMQLGISDNVRFVGAIAYDEMPAYYTLADITISVPPSDGLPQTIFEAYGCGSFLILGDLPQYTGVVQDGITGRLVPVGNVQKLKEALLWAAATPGVRQNASRLGREYVEAEADFNVQAARMNEIYAELLYTRGMGAQS